MYRNSNLNRNLNWSNNFLPFRWYQFEVAIIWPSIKLPFPEQDSSDRKRQHGEKIAYWFIFKSCELLQMLILHSTPHRNFGVKKSVMDNEIGWDGKTLTEGRLQRKMKDEGKSFLQRVFFKCSLNQIQPRKTTQKSIINHSKGKSGGRRCWLGFSQKHLMTLNCVKVMEAETGGRQFIWWNLMMLILLRVALYFVINNL